MEYSQTIYAGVNELTPVFINNPNFSSNVVFWDKSAGMNHQGQFVFYAFPVINRYSTKILATLPEIKILKESDNQKTSYSVEECDNIQIEAEMFINEDLIQNCVGEQMYFAPNGNYYGTNLGHTMMARIILYRAYGQDECYNCEDELEAMGYVRISNIEFNGDITNEQYRSMKTVADSFEYEIVPNGIRLAIEAYEDRF